MTLSDAQIERYSRQILLPEVGGRGQERLLAARVCVVGGDEAAALAATLVGRAGVGRLDVVGALRLGTLPPDCTLARHADASSASSADVVIDLADDPSLTARLARRAQRCVHVVGVRRGTRVTVATMVGRPCGVCLPAEALGVPPADAGPDALEQPAALALGALASAEALRVLWRAPDTGRLQSLDLATGACAGRVLTAEAGCAVCGGSA